MKLKVSEWGNSRAMRMSSTILEHLQAKAGDEVEVTLTNTGLEIMKNKSLDYLEVVRNEVADAVLQQGDAVS